MIFFKLMQYLRRFIGSPDILWEKVSKYTISKMTTLLQEAITQIKKLPESEQNDIAQMLLNRLNKSNFEIKGIKGKDLIKFADFIPYDDLQLISQAILEDCGRVDLNEW